jgi:hypothetical protein
MSLPAGTYPPAPDEIDETEGPVHAIDGDGTALWTGGDLEQIDHRTWNDVTEDRRCRTCEALAQ